MKKVPVFTLSYTELFVQANGFEQNNVAVLNLFHNFDLSKKK